MTRTEAFQEPRPLLFSIAYRIPGSVGNAESAVQETWLRYEASSTPHTSTRVFPSAAVTRTSIDVLREVFGSPEVASAVGSLRGRRGRRTFARSFASKRISAV